VKHVLIVHGWGNTRAHDHWQRHLAGALRRQGHGVHYPQLPDTETPNFADWAEVVIAELEMIAEVAEPGAEVVVVTHSLGCSTWLRLAVDGLLPGVVDRILMVAPADQAMLTDVPSFIIEPTPLVRDALKASAKSVVLLGSDADPWSPKGIHETYGTPLEMTPIVIDGAKHFALGDGWGFWQGVIDWVNDPNADLTVR
jgi:predicted alpha/beta hydrolase family esterase